jgi:oligopeptidase B
MKPQFFILILVASSLMLIKCKDMKSDEKQKLKPPVAEKKPETLTAHGDERIDNYYWMRLSDEQKRSEKPDAQTQKVLDYLNAENAYTDSILSHTKEFREDLFEEIKSRMKEDDESVPYFKNGYWYYTRFETGNEYPIYCRKKESLESQEQILLNVNQLAEGYEFYNVGSLSVSPDNKLLAYSEDTLSRRIYTIKFINLETGEMLEDAIPNTQGEAAWANDNETVFYTSKNKVTLLSEEIKRHQLGSDPENDATVYHEADPSFYIGVDRSKSGKFIIISNSSTLVSDYHILSTDNPKGAFAQFTPRESDMLYSIDHFEDRFYIVTNWNAKNFRLMTTGIGTTEKSNWKEVIPHRADVLLENIEVFSNYLVLDERKAGQTNLRVIEQDTGDEHYIDFGEPAYTAYISTNPEFDTEWLRFGYTSMTTPNSTYDYNLKTREKVLKKRQEVIGGHDPGEYVTERIFAVARDGVEVPISVVYKKGFEKDGNGPLLLYGYGSYGSTIDPSFSVARLSLLNRGIAFAIAHIRGSQMLGRQWYEEGKLLKKKNTFFDFIDCAKYLIERNYTSREHIYAMGGSAGGLLMGAVLNYEPTLFNGVVAAVPFVDVVTTMSDPTIPLTTNEYDEWGNPEASKEYYDYMLSYSPYDQVEAKDYTNILVTTGLFDSQVQYWEPAKWVAKMRDLKTDDNMLLMHTNMEAGHGGASGRYERIKEIALEYAFILNLEGIHE